MSISFGFSYESPYLFAEPHVLLMSGKVIVAFWIDAAEFFDVLVVGLGGKNEEALFTLNQVKTTLRGNAAMMTMHTLRK